MYDYNSAPPPRPGFEVIPANTLADVAMRIRPGNAGEGGWLKRSKDGGCEMLDIEYVVLSGPYAKRKFWGNMILSGSTAGHAKAADFSRGTLRTIIESARGIKPSDASPEARAARTVEIADFDGMSFVAKIGVEVGKPKNDGSGESYADKNVLVAAITPDKSDWHQVDQILAAPVNGGGAAAFAPANAAAPVAAIAKPGWAE